MELSREQFSKISHLFPSHKGPFVITNYEVLKAILYIKEHRCNWHNLPAHFGDWRTIYTRMNRWLKTGLLGKIFIELTALKIMNEERKQEALDTAFVKVYKKTKRAVERKNAGVVKI